MENNEVKRGGSFRRGVTEEKEDKEEEGREQSGEKREERGKEQKPQRNRSNPR